MNRQCLLKIEETSAQSCLAVWIKIIINFKVEDQKRKFTEVILEN